MPIAKPFKCRLNRYYIFVLYDFTPHKTCHFDCPDTSNATSIVLILHSLPSCKHSCFQTKCCSSSHIPYDRLVSNFYSCKTLQFAWSLYLTSNLILRRCGNVEIFICEYADRDKTLLKETVEPTQSRKPVIVVNISPWCMNVCLRF